MKKLYRLIWLLPVFLSVGVNGQVKKTVQTPSFRHDYSKTLVMKMAMAVPDEQGGSKVFINFERALEIIRETDAITLGIPKIIYLVGSQYNGHDDKYPAFSELNEHLKRPGDKTAKESLNWLYQEAKKYHTTISLHINMTDAYDNSPLWKTYVDNGLISKNADGSLMVVGNYNNRKAYQVNYREEWQKGFAKKRIDDLLKLLPFLTEAGTIHIDAWIARENKYAYETLVEEATFQKKIAGYWISKGIDPTSEWAMDYMTGLIPYYWHFNHRTQSDFLKVPAGLVTGGHFNPDLRMSDFGLEFLFGTSMYGENLFPGANNRNVTRENWHLAFARDFYLNTLQYYFLNSLQRLRVTGAGTDRTSFFSGGVKVSLADSTVAQGNNILRKGSTVCFPVLWRKDGSRAAYSVKDTLATFRLPETWMGVKRIVASEIGHTGLKKIEMIQPVKGQFTIRLKAQRPLLLQAE